MPGQNRKGPEGNGPLTGKGMGPCGNKKGTRFPASNNENATGKGLAKGKNRRTVNSRKQGKRACNGRSNSR